VITSWNALQTQSSLRLSTNKCSPFHGLRHVHTKGHQLQASSQTGPMLISLRRPTAYQNLVISTYKCRKHSHDLTPPYASCKYCSFDHNDHLPGTRQLTRPDKLTGKLMEKTQVLLSLYTTLQLGKVLIA
jgi:hypothetical protein